MLILEIMLAIIIVIVLVAVFCFLLFGAAVIIAKVSSHNAEKKEQDKRERYPDYYAKLAEYDAKYGEAVRFENENIAPKKKEIDDLETEIKYLPMVHVSEKLARIEKLKSEIYENTWVLKKMVQNYTLAKEEATALRQKYSIE